MGMMRFHAGRMVLNLERTVWHVRIKLGSSPEHQVKASLETSNAEEAIFKAERIYADLKRKLSKRVDDRPMCWQCIHWEGINAQCGFGWPEARQTGGRFAAQCSVFKACPTRK
jgi:hypothetical protein